MKTLKALAVFAILVCICGCSVFEKAVGTSTEALVDEKVRHTKIFDKDISYCYEKSIDALKKWQANAFSVSENDHIIATRLDKVFNSCIDTTEVGIFFIKLEGGKTQVEVSSLNYQLGQFVAENLFKYIENPDAPTCPTIVKGKTFKL